MNITRKISAFQIFSIMILSRIVALFTFVLPSASEMPAFDRALSALSIILFEIFYSLFLFAVINKSDNTGLISYVSGVSPKAAKICALIYAFGFIWFAGISVARFEIFISTVMFPNSELQLMAILLITTSAIGAVKGLEAIARTSVFTFFILFASIITIIVSVVDSFEYTNLKPIFSVGILNNLRFSAFISVRSAELPSLLIISPHVKGNLKKTTLAWIVFFGIVSLTLLTVLSGVTGEFGDNQMFQLYTLTTIAKIGVIERIDNIFIGIWVLCAMIKAAYFLLAAEFAVEQGFDIKDSKTVCCLIALGIFIVYKLSSKTIIVFTRFAGSAAQSVLFITLTAAVPLAAIIFSSLKERRKV